ncbi:MAG TPA: DUF488 domain-containing protein [Thermomicrobiales bacterium]|nr:DUF488 domain-containing protein [Thermomicrobiales bacterium]
MTGSTNLTGSPLTIYTIGHSTRPIGEFIDLLQKNGIETLVDIRTIPKSRHNPQYWHDALAASLAWAGIAYTRLPGLGGRRRASPDSINTAWRNMSFRGYADHMQTEEFREALDELIGIAKTSTTVIMCSEAVPWRCHRSLVGDALLVRGIDVIDIMGPTSNRPEKLTPWAHVEGTTITYPGVEGGDVRDET